MIIPVVFNYSANTSSAEINPYLREQKELPSLPHLILAPGTLIPQWESELKSLFIPHSFSILVYGVGKQAHADFWAPDGAFHTAQGNASQKIILASHSVSPRFISRCLLSYLRHEGSTAGLFPHLYVEETASWRDSLAKADASTLV